MRYFISRPGLGVKLFTHAVRSHWSVENSCHWTLDITSREDKSRIREKQLRQNMAWLNRHTLSLLKQQTNRKSVAMNRGRCGWDDNALLQVLTGVQTECALAQVPRGAATCRCVGFVLAGHSAA